MDRLLHALGDVSWGVVTASEGAFCVPDTPAHGVIPISPSVALIRDTRSASITAGNVADINRQMQLRATAYLFATSLRDCPGLQPPR